jgi:hypothetical protein
MQQSKQDDKTRLTERSPADNSTFAIGGVSCSADSLVVAESSVLRIKFSGKNPAHRKSAKRYCQAEKKTVRRLTPLIQVYFAEKVSFAENIEYICRIICVK